jgi:hypothetical protein
MLMADECPSACARCCKSLRNEGFIGDRDCRSRNRQRGGEFPRSRQPLSRSKAPVQNGLPDLAVYLAAKVISTHKTDMKSQSHELALFRIGLATMLKGQCSILPRGSLAHRTRQNWTGRECMNWHFNPGPFIPYDRPWLALKGR